MRVTRCFSFDPVRDKFLLDYIDKSENASAEVRELLNTKLKKGMTENDKLVEKIVQGVVSKLGAVNVPEPITDKKSIKVDSEDIASIKNILNMK